MTLTFGSLFSGAGLMDLGMHQAGLECRWMCEIDKDARRVLAHHWLHLPCHEDVRSVGRHNLVPVDVIVGGFPCQDLSVAGQRAGIQGGTKSGLWWEMLRVIGELQPRVVLLENVPGLLSSDGGRDLRRVCSSLAEHHYFGCVRTLDARYFGVPQRRRRLFGVFTRNDPTAGRAAQILALRESRSRHPPKGSEAGQDVAYALAASARGTGDGHGQGWNTTYATADGRSLSDVAGALNFGNTKGGFRTEPGEHLALARCQTPGEGKRLDGDSCSFVAHALTSQGADADEDGTGRGTPLVVMPIDMRQASRGEKMTNNRSDGACSGGAPGTGIGEPGDPCPSLADTHTPAVAFQPYNIVGLGQQGKNHAYPTDVTGALQHKGNSASGNEAGTVIAWTQRTREGQANVESQSDLAYALDAPKDGGRKKGGIVHNMMVRRLTPTECLRLMGAPDSWLDLEPPLSDSAKYRLCGNGVVVPVARWIGKRIVEAIG